MRGRANAAKRRPIAFLEALAFEERG